MTTLRRQLISYIAPGAPATRRPASGREPRLRPEIGFTPSWYRAALGIDFGERFHTDPAYRCEAVIAMRDELRRRFPGTGIGGLDRPEPLDLLTGTYGACSVAAMYGIPIRFASDNWPNCEHRYLEDEQVDALLPPDLGANAFFQDLMRQVDRIADREGRVEGFLNWQGTLNNAYRLRGAQLFCDMLEAPDRARHLLDCVCTTMMDGARRLHARQRRTGAIVDFFTVSNCLVNMVSPAQYRNLLLPFDRKIAEAFGCLGIHNCAWTADPYLDHYAQAPNLAYIDMGIDSDLPRARALFPNARRAIMYTPMDLADKSPEALRADLARIARDYAPCDLVAADIEAGTPDERVLALLELCEEFSRP